MARSNYSYAKRLKEIARQKKQEEKRLRKQAKAGTAPDEGPRPAGGEQEGEAQEPAKASTDVSEESRTGLNEPKAQ